MIPEEDDARSQHAKEGDARSHHAKEDKEKSHQAKEDDKMHDLANKMSGFMDDVESRTIQFARDLREEFARAVEQGRAAGYREGYHEGCEEATVKATTEAYEKGKADGMIEERRRAGRKMQEETKTDKMNDNHAEALKREFIRGHDEAKRSWSDMREKMSEQLEAAYERGKKDAAKTQKTPLPPPPAPPLPPAPPVPPASKPRIIAPRVQLRSRSRSKDSYKGSCKSDKK
jgi:hypothetical protein